jgi:hypothetical protein
MQVAVSKDKQRSNWDCCEPPTDWDNFLRAGGIREPWPACQELEQL